MNFCRLFQQIDDFLQFLLLFSIHFSFYRQITIWNFRIHSIVAHIFYQIFYDTFLTSCSCYLSPLHIFQIIGILLDFLISSSFFVALCNIFSSRQIVFFYLLFRNRRSILLYRFITFFCRGFSLFFLDRLSIDAIKNRVKKAIIYFQYFWFKIVYDYFAFSNDILNQKAPIFDEVINNHNHIYLYLELIVICSTLFSPHFYFNFIAFPSSVRGSFSSIF